MEETRQFSIRLRHEGEYRFMVEFDNPDFEELLLDEPPPLGGDAGPNAARILSASVANCLSASLLFCLKKARIQARDIEATAMTTIERNDRGRFRIAAINVRISPTLEEQDVERIARCARVYEDFCIVSASVRQGIDIQAELAPVTAPPGAAADPD